MNHKWKWCNFSLCLIILLITSISSAQIYKFRDKNGVLRYTDNFEDVPEEQRDSEESYSISPESKEKNSNRMITNESKKNEDEKSVPDENMLKSLQKEKEKLDNEYEKLQKKIELLNQEQSNVVNRPYDRTLHEEKVKKLNNEIEDYEKRRKDFEKDAAKLNMN